MRDGDVLLADDREANKAWCVWIGKNYSCTSRRNCCKTSIPGLSRRGFKNGMFALFFSPNLFWVFLTGYGLVTEGLETLVLHAYSHKSKSKCFLKLRSSSVLQSWRFVSERV